MAYVLDKLKTFLAANGASLIGAKRRNALLSLVRTDVDPTTVWENVENIGDGSFGQIYKAVHKETGQVAALKQVNVTSVEDLDDHAVEIVILSQTSHKNVVRLLEAYHHDAKLWIYLEYCTGGAVDRIMYELERPLTEPQIRCVCRQVCEGLAYLHGNGVIHRDLKAGNILLTADGQVKLADFGISAKNQSIDQKRNSYVGTPYWMAPEVINCETIKDEPYDYKSDIWSLGITLIELAQIHPPHHNMNPGRVAMRIHHADPPTLDLPHKWSPKFNDFLAKCLQKAPALRPTASELLQHPFLVSGSLDGQLSLVQLISEANADVTLEVKDIENGSVDNVDQSLTPDSSDNQSAASMMVTSFITTSAVAKGLEMNGNASAKKPAPMPPDPPSNTIPLPNGEKSGATANVSSPSFPSTNRGEASAKKNNFGLVQRLVRCGPAPPGRRIFPQNPSKTR